MKKLPRIVSAEAVIHGVLKIVWNDGYEGVVDLRPVIDRGRLEVGEDGRDDLLSQRYRRDRAVGARSEGTLVEQRGEGREQLPLAGAPVRQPAHRTVDGVGERPPE